VSTLLDVVQILSDNPHITMDENYTGEEVEKTEEPAAGSNSSVWGNIAAFVERLDDELFKSLQVSLENGPPPFSRHKPALRPPLQEDFGSKALLWDTRVKFHD